MHGHRTIQSIDLVHSPSTSFLLALPKVPVFVQTAFPHLHTSPGLKLHNGFVGFVLLCFFFFFVALGEGGSLIAKLIPKVIYWWSVGVFFLFFSSLLLLFLFKEI